MLNKKTYILFGLCVFSFLVGILSSAYSYTKWNSYYTPDDEYIEVSLPIIRWDDYLSLSKAQ